MKPLGCYLAFVSLSVLSVLALGCAHTHTAVSANAVAPAALRSPWDLSPVALSQRPYNCGPVIPLAPDLSITTNLQTSAAPVSEGVKSAAYAESSEALQDLARRVLQAADTFRRNGSAAAAQCVATLLTAAAEDHAMNGQMASRQAWKDQNLALRGIAIAFLKVRESGEFSPDQSALIVAWMSSVVAQEVNHYADAHCGPNGCARLGHQGLETAMAAAAVAIAANDRGLFNAAVNQYKAAVSHIDDHGMLHYDMDHGHALKFNIESAAALVQIAEFAQANGEPLYGFDGGRIHLLVHSVTRGLIDPSPFRIATGSDQQMPSKLETWEISWASVYDQRFPDPVLDQLLQQINFKGSDMWGGQPWSLPAAS